MKILVSGSSGLVGKALVSFLKGAGHQVISLVRGEAPSTSNTLYWDPTNGKAEIEAFEGFDVVFHLAGKNIASSFWTKKHKNEVLISRARDTWLLCQILSRTKKPPKTFISASAVGIYGNRPGEVLTEKSPPGEGFLASVCKKWEEAGASLETRGTRVVSARFGIILSKKGGMLAQLLPLFRLGVGAIIGSGKQMVSWIALDDVVEGLNHVMQTESLKGPVNFTAPQPLTNAEFSKMLAEVVHRPLFFRIPATVLKWVLGEMAEEMLLTSVDARPQKLLDSGFVFRLPTLPEACGSV